MLENLLIRFCPEVKLVDKCKDLEEAVESIKKNSPQLVFLDIEMRNHAGYEIVNYFDEINFEIVFVTAWDNYAIRAFEVAAIDYLLKPVDIERLKKSVKRVIQKSAAKNLSQNLNLLEKTIESKSISSVIITEKGNQIPVNLENIIAIEAQESYCNVYCTNRKYLVSKNLRHFENILADNPLFFRSHKSWIINKKHLLSFSHSTNTILLSDQIEARLSKYRKEEFETFIA
ncbi:MAG: response regulator transcription factor [Crocinitomicaceae bacterium]|nr:response regulator transcription factor [Crocinitomicaceae bacterium]